jgi:hypothetical protein
MQGWWGSQILCYYSCFTFKVDSFGSIETPKLAVSLFRETTKTNLFVSDSVKTSCGPSFSSFAINEFRSTPYLS